MVPMLAISARVMAVLIPAATVACGVAAYDVAKSAGIKVCTKTRNLFKKANAEVKSERINHPLGSK